MMHVLHTGMSVHAVLNRNVISALEPPPFHRCRLRAAWYTVCMRSLYMSVIMAI